MATFLLSSLSLYSPRLSKPYTLPKLGLLKFPNQTLCKLPNPQPSIQFHPIRRVVPKIPCSHDPNPSVLTSFQQKATILIVGSLLLLGRFNTKPALALSDASKTTTSEKLNEKNGVQNEKMEDEGLYEKILEQNPDDIEALKVILYGRMKKGKIGEAVKCVERLISLEPEEVEWRLLEALCCELMGDIGKAKELFEDILEERPLLIRALHVSMFSLVCFV